MTSPGKNRCHQAGAMLVEVLISIGLLSFGVLALGVMLSFAVQMPKLSGYRATATSLASSHIERIRANPVGFNSGAYNLALSYDGTSNDVGLTDCNYPDCTAASLATMDNAATMRAARIQLPAGGMLVKCDPSPCGSNSYGNLWIFWQEPISRATLDPSTSDNCPAQVTNTYTNPRPRCLYVRFQT